MGIQILRPEIEEFRRIIVISDVRGNLRVLQELLGKVRYTINDVLILLGDLIEKGPESLQTVRYVMELAKTHRIYAVLGNYDTICKELLRDDRNRELLQYVLNQPHSLIREMCEAVNIPLRPNTNMYLVKQSLRVLFEQEIAYLCGFPHMIELDHFIFAHAQVLPGDPESMRPADALRGDAFMGKGYSFEKYAVVGHWPVMLYDDGRRDAKPRIDRKRKIISLDGGISVKRDGQLNALVIPNPNSTEFQIEYADALPKAKIRNSQAAGEDRNTIDWTDNVVKPLREANDFVYCRHESTGVCYWIPKTYLSKRDGIWYTEDVTDYQIRTTYEEIVSVVEDTSRGYLIKNHGVTGWYYGMLDFDNVVSQI